MGKGRGGLHFMKAIGSQEGEFHGLRKFKLANAYRIAAIVGVNVDAGVGLQ